MSISVLRLANGLNSPDLQTGSWGASLKQSGQLPGWEPTAALWDWWHAHAPTPMQTPAWMLRWWKEFQPSRAELCLLTVLNDQELIGLAPWYVQESWDFCRTLRFLANGKVCSDFQSILAADGRADDVVDALARWLLHDGSTGWSMLELDGVAFSDANVARLLSHFQLAGYPVQPIDLPSTWRLELHGGWECVLSRMSKSCRYQSRRAVRDFVANSSRRLRIVDQPSDYTSALESLVELHQVRWQASGQPGCFSDPRFTRFLKRSIGDLIKAGEAEIYVLEERGTAIAAALMLLDCQGNGYMYQIGRDPSRAKESIGRTLNALVIKNACEQRRGFIDYLRGNEVFKPRLRAVPTANTRFHVYAKALIPQLHYQVSVVRQSVKRQVHSAVHWLDFSSNRSTVDVAALDHATHHTPQ